MEYKDIVKMWNSQADENNQWDDLVEDEKIEFAYNCRSENVVCDPYPIEVKLRYEGLIALLQGKNYHLMSNVNKQRFIFIPPFDGVFMTHQELANLRMQHETNVLELINELSNHGDNNE